MHRLILASESPRRRNLLQRAGFKFTVFPVKVSEIPDENLNVAEQISAIARTKADAALEALSRTSAPSDPPFVLLTADTEVIFGGRPLGKPSSPEDAARTLRRLSGRDHDVITAVWMIDSLRPSQGVSHIETTKIRFRDLTDGEILAYVATGDPLDKAGSYGIQSGAGHLVEKIEGDLDNVVGLPVKAILELVKREGWSFSG